MENNYAIETENKKSLLRKLQEKNPKTHVVVNAINNLKEISDMKEFIKDYILHLKNCSKKLQYSPVEIARQDIMTFLGYCGGNNERWAKAYEEYTKENSSTY